MSSLTKKIYNSSIDKLSKEFGYTNHMQFPKLLAVSLNVGIKSVDSDNKTIAYVQDQLSKISGQKSVVTYSRKAISTFKLRKFMPIGCKVTLRGKKMYNFLDKLINVSLPRIRDFRGLSSNGFNSSNHFSFGLKDHSIFLEVDPDNIQKSFGMNINIVTNAKSIPESLSLLKIINLPIK